MAFRMQYAVTMPCSLGEAQNLLLESNNFVQLQETLPSCTKCEILSYASSGEAVKTEPTITKEDLMRCLDSQTLPAHLPWPPLSNPQDNSHATYFKFIEMGYTHVAGSQYVSKDLNAVFFHSHVASAGIEEYKLRVLREDKNGENIEVFETVWGQAPWWLALALKLSGLARRTHAKHMDLYHTLISKKD